MSPANPRKTFLWVAVIVFVAVSGLWALRTMIQPRSYASSARVDLKSLSGRSDAAAQLQAQADLALSEAVLNPVVEHLHLNERWGREIRVDGALKTWESVTLLKQKLAVAPIPGENALEIRVDYVDAGDEAAKIANAVADTLCAQSSLRPQVSQRAQPAPQPAHPDIPLNLILGGIGGLVLALALGAAAATLVSQLNQATAKSTTMEKST